MKKEEAGAACCDSLAMLCRKRLYWSNIDELEQTLVNSNELFKLPLGIINKKKEL